MKDLEVEEDFYGGGQDYYKDGLHILIGMKLKHDMQQLFR